MKIICYFAKMQSSKIKARFRFGRGGIGLEVLNKGRMAIRVMPFHEIVLRPFVEQEISMQRTSEPRARFVSSSVKREDMSSSQPIRAKGARGLAQAAAHALELHLLEATVAASLALGEPLQEAQNQNARE